jgi:hypothetical protein
VLADLASRVFEVLPIVDSHYQFAEELIVRYGFHYRLRTLNAVQLAAALDRHETRALDGFVAADHVLSQVVTAEKVPIVVL